MSPIGSSADHGLKAEELADRLRRRILAESMPPGAGLPSEAELIAEYSLSRATVREAIRILDAEGFVEVRRGRYGGVHVRHPSVDDFSSWLAAQLTLRATPIRALIELCLVMEPAATALAADRATTDRLRALADSSDPSAWLEFHQLIAEASGNDLVDLTLRALHAALGDITIRRGFMKADLGLGAAAHRRILRAIEERDGEWAAAIMRKHLGAANIATENSHDLDGPLLPPSHWE